MYTLSTTTNYHLMCKLGQLTASSVLYKCPLLDNISKQRISPELINMETQLFNQHTELKTELEDSYTHLYLQSSKVPFFIKTIVD